MEELVRIRTVMVDLCGQRQRHRTRKCLPREQVFEPTGFLPVPRVIVAVSSQTDSRTILDMGGAEKLLGKGDMLFYPLGAAKPVRLQGAFISEAESERVIEHVKSQVKEEIKYEECIVDTISKMSKEQASDEDDLLSDAIEFVVESGQASASMLQRKFKIGFNRAARLIDSMEERAIVGKSEGSKPRKVLVSKQDLENLEGE